MALLTREELRSLLDEGEPPCVSIYLPTHRAGLETQQDRIRLKNLLRQAEEQLVERGMGRTALAQMLEPPRRLLEDGTFWQHQSDGLAVFAAANAFRRFRVPLSFAELALVGERFHVAPLLPLLGGDRPFHVLALSQNRVRLFEANRHDIRELDLHDIPESLAEALGYDFEQRSLQFHTGTGAPQQVAVKGRAQGAGGPIHGGRRAAMFHGHGAGVDDSKEEVHKFLQIVDDGVRRLLRNPQAPLVVAAVDWVNAMYHEVSKHPSVLPQGVEGNPDAWSPQELHAKAWQLAEPHFRKSQQEAAQAFDDMASNGRASHHLEDVLTAAFDGRVDTLFVDVEEHRWGRFDTAQREVELHGERENGDEDLLDRAALECLVHGGTVFAVESSQVPGGGPVAAVYRY